jgi:outer membrane lipoprotein SlyB
MNTDSDRSGASNTSTRVVITVAAIAVTVFCAAGFAALMGWLPTSRGDAAEPSVMDQVVPQRPATTSPRAPVKDRVVAQKESAKAVATESAPARAGSWPAAKPVACADCGVIESTREVQAAGEGSGLGAAGGAIVGGLLGSQVGAGRGRDLATVVGAVGGAVGGNQVEKSMKSSKSYEIVVRLEDGTTRVIQQAAAPVWRLGDRVRVVDGVIRSNG